MLVCGLIGAAVIYGIETWTADPALDDMTALGYTRSMQHGMGVMMGPMGLILTDWQHDLTSPIGQALTVAIVAALVAAYFFRVAWVIDADAQDLE